jgi:DNA-binding CsgD family transcriptional regulator
MWKALEEFSIKCNRIDDVNSLCAALEAFLTEQKFNFYAFGNLFGDKSALIEDMGPAVAMNLPEAWVNRYFEKQYFDIDPVVLAVPYVQRYLKWDNLRAYQPEFFAEAATFGLKNGIAIPLRSFDGCYVLSIMSSKEFEITQDQITVLEMAARHFFRCYLTIRKIKHEPVAISDKQIQAIQLAMLGKRTADIAKVIDRTPSGVEFMLKDARKQLDCKTLPELVGKAVLQGIVTIE